MPQPLNILTDAEIAQMQALLARIQQSRPTEKPAMLLCHAFEDSLNGALCINSGSYGLAPGCLNDAGKTVRDVMVKF